MLEKCQAGILYRILMEEEWLSKDYNVIDWIGKIKKLKKVTFNTEYISLVFEMQNFQKFNESNLRLEKIILSLEIKATEQVMLQALAKKLCNTQEVCL